MPCGARWPAGWATRAPGRSRNVEGGGDRRPPGAGARLHAPQPELDRAAGRPRRQLPNPALALEQAEHAAQGLRQTADFRGEGGITFGVAPAKTADFGHTFSLVTPQCQRRAIRLWLDEYEVEGVDMIDVADSFFNVNTPEALQKSEELTDLYE